MSKDYIGYEALTDAALRGVVREALRRVEKQGLVGSHHFYLTFKTHFPGVDIPDFLKEQYPDEMTIVLQHQFWGLKVEDDHFEVTLTFRKLPAELVDPVCGADRLRRSRRAVRAAVQDGRGRGTGKPTRRAGRRQGRNPGTRRRRAGRGKRRRAPGEVVSLDAFRKK